jgi:hypothetical protein
MEVRRVFEGTESQVGLEVLVRGMVVAGLARGLVAEAG